MSTSLMFLHGLILFVLGFCALTLIANLIVFRGLRAASAPPHPPLVSILVPARDEERNIHACVESLLAQDYPNWELFVLDDHSTDATGNIARDLFNAHAGKQRREILNGQTLPGGWVGKNWACHQLAQNARGDFLFFTDADTIHAPGTVTAAVAFAQKNRADLVSAWPRMITETLGEKLIIPIIVVVGFAMCPHWLAVFLQRFPAIAAKLPKSVLRMVGGANGQFMFFSRRGYQRIGGHAKVKGNVVEDVTLGREVAEEIGNGLRLFNCESLQFSTVRMYRSFGETWLGFTKNLRAIFEEREVAFWLFLLAMWGCFLVPCFRWLWANEAIWPFAVAQFALVAAIRVAVTWRFSLTWLGALLHPLGIGLVIACALQSWRLSHTRGVEWKGRTYRPQI
jgi:chlorobactene glucosyltransferase